jgi:arylsulfatase
VEDGSHLFAECHFNCCSCYAGAPDSDNKLHSHSSKYNSCASQLQNHKGNLFSGSTSSTQAPIVTNLRMDPWERYQDESMNYGRWWGEKLWTMVPASVIVSQFLQTLVEFPPSQKSGGLTVSQFLDAVQNGASGAGK